MKPETFRVTEAHCLLLRNAVVWWDGREYGAPGIYCKKPYGNSDVLMDMAQILGYDLFEDCHGETHVSAKQAEALNNLHEELEVVLQILLSTLSLSPGTYQKVRAYSNKWIRQEDAS